MPCKETALMYGRHNFCNWYIGSLFSRKGSEKKVQNQSMRQKIGEQYHLVLWELPTCVLHLAAFFKNRYFNAFLVKNSYLAISKNILWAVFFTRLPNYSGISIFWHSKVKSGKSCDAPTKPKLEPQHFERHQNGFKTRWQ